MPDATTGPKPQVAAVLALHTERHFDLTDYPARVTLCSEDRQAWPCATIRALRDNVCSVCNGETWATEVEAQCSDAEHDHGERCMAPVQVTCPNCTTIAERTPPPGRRGYDPAEEPF